MAGIRIVHGIQAGLVAGLTVAAFFFVADLIQLTPLATPAALARSFMGPGGPHVDFPVLSQLVAIAGFGARLLMVTVLHFVAFAALGVLAVSLSDRTGIRLGGVTGALFGLVFLTAAFHGTFWLAGAHAVVGSPSDATILVANALAGAALGLTARTVARAAA